MSEPRRQLVIPTPPKDTFAFDLSNDAKLNDPLMTTKSQHERLPEIERIVGAGKEYEMAVGPNGQVYYKIIGEAPDVPTKTGWYIYHKDSPYPRKGFVFPAGLTACEFPKRHLINWMARLKGKIFIPFYLIFALLPRKIKGKLIEVFLLQYLDICDAYLMQIYQKPDYYMEFCTEIRLFLTVFLTEMGVSLNTANRFGYAFATILEFDSAYRFRLEDLFTETSKGKMLANPVGEAKRLVEILGQRDNRPHMLVKFNRFAILLKYAFWFIKKPFKLALQDIDFSKLQFDAIDRFEVQHQIGYDWFGETIEKRLEKYERVNIPAVVLT